MCGRYLIKSDIEEIISKYGVDMYQYGYVPKEEIFPSDTAPVIVGEQKKELKLMKWGFTLPFNKALIINSRAETIEEKPLFRNSFYTKRCIVPANAFFEWKKCGGKSVKHSISFKDRSLFSLAGIYGNFTDKTGTFITRFSIITVPPNELVSTLHNRMPLILDRKDEDIWLNRHSDIEGIRELLNPFSSENMILYPA
jgi:putative SOS response-associated peptidase YedK